MLSKRFGLSVLAAASMIGFSAAPVGAAHCFETRPNEPNTPGFSYFGKVHVGLTAHDNEGGGVHAGTSGASNCLEAGPSPSTRAPGKM